MRRRTAFAAMAVLTCAFVHPAFAATLEWTYALPEGAFPSHLVTDDTGGAAFKYDDASAGVTKVVWVDGRGNVRYQRDFPQDTTSIILGVNNRALVLDIGAQNKLLVVEKNGTQTEVPNSGNATLIGNKVTDSSGFCAVAFDPDTGAITSVVRYTY